MCLALALYRLTAMAQDQTGACAGGCASRGVAFAVREDTRETIDCFEDGRPIGLADNGEGLDEGGFEVGLVFLETRQVECDVRVFPVAGEGIDALAHGGGEARAEIAKFLEELVAGELVMAIDRGPDGDVVLREVAGLPEDVDGVFGPVEMDDGLVAEVERIDLAGAPPIGGGCEQVIGWCGILVAEPG